jgi:NAD(P)-dependent dehydrogenase (short-subunit alcohol dehydrogenase family)
VSAARPGAPRTALVTGGGRGLGRSAALALAARGFHVIVTSRTGAAGTRDTVDGIRSRGGTATALALDLADPAALPGFAERVRAQLAAWEAPRLDVLVNNAGVGVFEPLEAVTAESIDTVLATNVRGTYLLIQALVPRMAEGGRIITVSSSLTRHVSVATSVYAASKAAVEAFSRSLALELGPRGIRVNVVAPGPTETDFNGGAMRDDPELRATLAEHTALGRVGHPDEIGDAIAALASDELRWVTAERLEVSGGALL